MKYFNLSPIFAANYNCGAYGAGNFDDGVTCGTQTSPTNGNLINTGMDFYVPLAIGVVLIVTAFTIIFLSVKKRRSHKR